MRLLRPPRRETEANRNASCLWGAKVNRSTTGKASDGTDARPRLVAKVGDAYKAAWKFVQDLTA